jgi:MOSC domain-containing protein YiiM
MRVTFLGVADQPGSFLTRKVEVLALSYAGIEGDRHAGLTARAGVRQDHLDPDVVVRNSRQLSLVSAEELAAAAGALGVPRLDPSWLGANVSLEGAPGLTATGPSTRLVFRSGAVLVVDGDNAPCTSAGGAVAAALGDPSLRSRFVKAATARRGLVAWVERVGTIRVGDAVEVFPRSPAR